MAPSQLLEFAPFIIGGWFSPIPILVLLILLSRPGGVARSFAFVAGLSGVCAALGFAGLALGGEMGAMGEPGPTPAGSIVTLVLGVSFLVGLVQNLLDRSGEPMRPPRVLGALDEVGLPGSVGLGALVMLMSVGNVALLFGAVGVILASEGVFGEHALWLGGFLVAFVFVMTWPLVVYLLFSERVAPRLVRGRAWLEQNLRPVTVVVLAIFGVAFSLQGARGVWALWFAG